MDKLKELLPLLAKRLKDQETDSSSSDDDVDLHILNRIQAMEEKRNATNPVDCMHGVEQYSATEFKKQFRVSRKTFHFLLAILKTDLYDMVLKDSRTLAPRQQLLIALYKMTSNVSYRLLSRNFNVGRFVVRRIIQRVTHALFRRASQFIKWPTPYSNRLKVMKEFQALSGFPHVIGVIDDVLIRIPKPLHNAEAYDNGRKKYSVHLQVVCDHTSLITHCATGEPGSVTDQTVFKASGMENLINNSRKFPGEAVLIGNEGYKLHPRLMTPFPKRSLRAKERNYNNHHAMAHQVVERCWKLLSGRMQSLLKPLPSTRLKSIPEYIVACCVIHNICIMQGDTIDIENLPPIDKPKILVAHRDSTVGRHKRIWIMNSLKD